MNVDAHLHIKYRHLQSVNDVIGYLDRKGMDCCWLLTWDEAAHKFWAYEDLSVESVMEAFYKYPERIIPMYAPDPLRADASERLKKWHGLGIKGCAELKSTARLESYDLRALLDTVTTLGLPVLFHMEQSQDLYISLDSDTVFEVYLLKSLRTRHLKKIPMAIFDFLSEFFPYLLQWKKNRTFRFPGYLLDMANLATILEAYPTIRFIGHGPEFWKHLSSDITPEIYPKGIIREEGITPRLLRKYTNLYADISGGSGYFALSRDWAFVRRFVDEFADKLTYGTDNDDFDRHALLGRLGLGEAALKKIYGLNAQKLLGSA